MARHVFFTPGVSLLLLLCFTAKQALAGISVNHSCHVWPHGEASFLLQADYVAATIPGLASASVEIVNATWKEDSTCGYVTTLTLGTSQPGLSGEWGMTIYREEPFANTTPWNCYDMTVEFTLETPHLTYYASFLSGVYLDRMKAMGIGSTSKRGYRCPYLKLMLTDYSWLEVKNFRLVPYLNAGHALTDDGECGVGRGLTRLRSFRLRRLHQAPGWPGCNSDGRIPMTIQIDHRIDTTFIRLAYVPCISRDFTNTFGSRDPHNALIEPPLQIKRKSR